MPLQNPFVFYPWHWCKTTKGSLTYLVTLARLHLMLRRILADPNRLEYRDAAITPAGADKSADHLVEATRVTDYARRRMTNSAKARAAAEVS